LPRRAFFERDRVLEIDAAVFLVDEGGAFVVEFGYGGRVGDVMYGPSVWILDVHNASIIYELLQDLRLEHRLGLSIFRRDVPFH
jgi:hypothetical protein